MLLLCSTLLLILNETTCSIVSVNGFTIVGTKLKTIFNNNVYSAFFRIPYAEPPIHGLRFKPPRLIAPFCSNNTYDYSHPYKDKILVDEDCLYLSIFTPISSKTKLFPVLVWPHKHTNNFGPDFLINEDILVVIVNFRSDIFGFLNTGDEFAEGNMGSKDIIMALTWLRDNISYFDGDPNRITILGSGDAATSVASMILNQAVDSLVKRAIIMDASALSPADYRMYNFEIANKLYWKLGGMFGHFDRKELYRSLDNISAKDLIVASRNLFDSTEVRDKQRLANCFSCSIESSGEEAFMFKSPVEIYDNNTVSNVDVIFGYTTLPLLYKLKGITENRKLLKYLNYNFQYLLPFEGKYDEYESIRYKKIRKEIMDYYFVNGTITEVSLRRYSKYVSDQVLYPLLRQATLHASISKRNVYLYRFSFNGELNVRWRSSLNNVKWNGATLGDELCYLFRCKFENLYKIGKSNENTFISRIVRLFANFVKCGVPTPTPTDNILGSLNWLPLKHNTTLQAMSFGNTFKMVNVPEEERLEFWNKLMDEYF